MPRLGTKMAKYFKREEFACKCGCGTNEIVDQFIEQLDDARAIAGVPFHITSGYRCPDHNKSVGGASESAHTSGMAADIAVTDSRTRFLILSGLIQAGFNRLGIAKTFIHADMDPAKDPDVVWLYS